MQPRRAPGQVAYGPPWGRIRAVRSFDTRREIDRRMIVFGLGGPGRELGPDLERHLDRHLARALRAERRAARTWGRGYDLMRHLTLVRMQRTLDSRRQPLSSPGRRVAPSPGDPDSYGTTVPT